MIALKILDVKSFMASLLLQTVFDNFLMSEVDVITFNHFKITGTLHLAWYSQDEKEELEERKYSQWQEIKPIVYGLIKGNKTPLSFKIVLMLSPENTEKILLKNKIGLSKDDVNGLFINMKYESGKLTLITGCSIRTFTMDKTLEHEWDANMKVFLRHHGIVFEEM